MRPRAKILTLTASAALVVPAVAMSPASAAETATAPTVTPVENGSVVQASTASSSKAQKVKKKRIVVKIVGLPTGKTAKVVVTKRKANKPHKAYRPKKRQTYKIKSKKKHTFKIGKGHFRIVGKTVRVNGKKYKAHKADVVVLKKYGVMLNLRYYKPSHKHHPSKPSHKGSSTGSNPGTLFPASGNGVANGYDFGKNHYAKCNISWQLDPGPAVRKGIKVDTELNLIRGVLTSITKYAGYTFTERPASKSSPANLRFSYVDQLASPYASAGGLTTAYLNNNGFGPDITYSLIKLNASVLNSGPANTRANLYAHEIGHAFGLGHTSSPNEIMNPTVPLILGWGKGDLAGWGKMPSTCP